MRIDANHQLAPKVNLVQMSAAPYRAAPIGTKPAPSGRAAHITAEAELAHLVRVCGIAYQFTDDEHAEALAVALAAPVAALACFRAIAREVAPASREFVGGAE